MPRWLPSWGRWAVVAMSDELTAMRAERDHWIGEAHRYKLLYRSVNADGMKWFRRMRAAEGAVARVRATLSTADRLLSSERFCLAVPDPHRKWVEAAIADVRLALDGPEAAIEAPESDPGADRVGVDAREGCQDASEGER